MCKTNAEIRPLVCVSVDGEVDLVRRLWQFILEQNIQQAIRGCKETDHFFGLFSHEDGIRIRTWLAEQGVAVQEADSSPKKKDPTSAT